MRETERSFSYASDNPKEIQGGYTKILSKRTFFTNLKSVLTDNPN